MAPARPVRLRRRARGRPRLAALGAPHRRDASTADPADVDAAPSRRRTHAPAGSGPMIGHARVEVPAKVSATNQPAGSARMLPASGNAALAASAIVQGALGIEFALSGLN